MEPTIRRATAADLDFIADTWIRNYAQSVAVRQMRRTMYFDEQRVVMNAILSEALEAGGAYVACDPGGEDVLWGWIVGCPGTIHYVFVKTAFRGHGIGRKLMEIFETPSQGTFITHWPPEAHGSKDWTRAWIFEHVDNGRFLYNPYRAMRYGAISLEAAERGWNARGQKKAG